MKNTPFSTSRKSLSNKGRELQEGQHDEKHVPAYGGEWWRDIELLEALGGHCIVSKYIKINVFWPFLVLNDFWWSQISMVANNIYWDFTLH